MKCVWDLKEQGEWSWKEGGNKLCLV
jgi:hypothetical protein